MTRFVFRLPLMSVGPATSPRALFSIFGVVTLGVLMALATDVVLSQLPPVKVAFILGGFALLIPTVVMKHPKAYWLFLLVVSIPFDISKWLSTWLVDPPSLIDLYGQPASGTTAIELYLTDLVLVVMVLPWLARVAMSLASEGSVIRVISDDRWRVNQSIKAIYPHEENGVMAFNNTINPHWHLSV